MTRDDIIRMAREAGEAEGLESMPFHTVLERFAALVAAAEREACAECAHEYLKKRLVDKSVPQGCRDAIRARSEQ